MEGSNVSDSLGNSCLEVVSFAPLETAFYVPKIHSVLSHKIIPQCTKDGF